jgi:hypothetical protein
MLVFGASLEEFRRREHQKAIRALALLLLEFWPDNAAEKARAIASAISENQLSDKLREDASEDPRPALSLDALLEAISEIRAEAPQPA